MMLRWTIRAHPELADDDTAILIVRIVGVVMVLTSARIRVLRAS
jgi:hypothetical protein